MAAFTKGHGKDMSDEKHRRPGPWDVPSPAHVSAQPDTLAREAPPVLIKGQHPVVAIGGTLLFFGFIWWMSGSWVMATALIFGLIVHEYGHVLAMNRMGMGPARIYIIPFFGGLAQGQREAKSAWDGVLVSLAGPAFGLLASVPFFALWLGLGGKAWLLGAAVVAVINLVNLAPAPPLDGAKAIGPVLARIHPWVERAAMLMVGVVVVYWGIITERWILAAFLSIALLGHLRRGGWRPEGAPLSISQALASVALYLITAAACAGLGLAALMPLADGSFAGAMQIAGSYLGLRS